MRVGQAVVLIDGPAPRPGSSTHDMPAPLREVGGRPFVEHMIGHLSRFGVTEVLLLAGSQVVADRYHGRRLFGAAVSVIVEAKSLGTAGALRPVRDLLTERFFLCRGDSFFDGDMLPLLRLAADPVWAAALLLRVGDDTGHDGSFVVDGTGVSRGIGEKGSGGSGLTGSGISLVRRDAVMAEIAEDPCSLEHDVFHRLAARGALAGVLGRGQFVDVGGPDGLAAAQTNLKRRPLRPAAFLDRDGVLNRDDGYTHRPHQLHWIEGAPDAIRLLNEAGVPVFVVTNQAGVARGYYGEADVRSFHAHMQDSLLRQGAHIDGFYFCPHHPDGVVDRYAIACRCRKPGPGLLEQAAADWPVDRTRSFLIGDRDSDLAAAAAFGIRAARFDDGSASLVDLVVALSIPGDIGPRV